LFKAEEILGQTLLSWHNLGFYQDLMAHLRDAIAAGKFSEARQALRVRWGFDPS
jgi:queuine tRNA-ribosyltransferase